MPSVTFAPDAVLVPEQYAVAVNDRRLPVGTVPAESGFAAGGAAGWIPPAQPDAIMSNTPVRKRRRRRRRADCRIRITILLGTFESITIELQNLCRAGARRSI